MAPYDNTRNIMTLITDDPGTQSVLLKSLSEEARTRLLARGHKKKFKKGTTIFARGETGQTMLVIQTGRVEISVTTINGRKSILENLGPGEILGEIATFDGGERSADATAATVVTGLTLSRADIAAFLVDYPDAAMSIISELCQRIRLTNEIVETKTNITASARLTRCLLRLADKWGTEISDGDIKISQPFSQADIGEFSGLARENVNRRLKAWEADGIIGFDGRNIVIKDFDELERIADL